MGSPHLKFWGDCPPGHLSLRPCYIIGSTTPRVGQIAAYVTEDIA